jgi:ATPase subunit of ABC transporter with duplicated ATPase domains
MSTAPLLETHTLTIETPGGRTLVRELDLCLGRERVAVVGRNGVGKSTLLDVLAGRQEPARGRVVRRGRHLLVPQDLRGDAEAGPGIAASAGERQRRRLEAARAARPDLLLLDEPTRDLDAGNIAWLIDWVSQWQGGLLIVSHDRRVLRAFDQFFIVAESGCRHLAGGFDDLLTELEREREDTQRRYLAGINRLVAREEHHAAVRRRRQRKKNVGRIRELKRCPSRIKLNDKRSYKQESQGKRRVLQEARIGAARERAKAARRALPVELPLALAWPRRSDAPHPSPLPASRGEGTGVTPVISCEAVTAWAGGRTLFSELSLEIGRDRLAVRGANGSGKTTLLEVALGLRQPAGGRARCDASRVGYVAQNAANWCIGDSVLDQLSAQMEEASPDRMAEVLRAHRFPLALAGRPLATLSPGERVRAALICLGHRRAAPDLLVLDEPTQDLDFVGLAALEAVLAAWPGGLLVVSHDPEFLDAIGISRTLAL